MFIYREFDKDDTAIDEEKRNKVELIIAKHRNGETGSVELKWDGPSVRFLDVDKSRAAMAREQDIPPERGGGFSGFDGSEPFSLADKSAEEILSAPDDGDINDIF